MEQITNSSSWPDQEVGGSRFSGWRRRLRRARVGRRAAGVSAGAVVAVGTVAFKATPASACPFSHSNRSYAGQNSQSANYDGVAAHIYVPGGVTVPDGNESLAFHITDAYNLGAADQWWVQTGMVRGKAPNGAYYDEMKAYVERSGSDGYAFTGRPDLGYGVSANPQFKIAFNGSNNTYEYFFDGYVGTTYQGCAVVGCVGP